MDGSAYNYEPDRSVYYRRGTSPAIERERELRVRRYNKKRYRVLAWVMLGIIVATTSGCSSTSSSTKTANHQPTTLGSSTDSVGSGSSGSQSRPASSRSRKPRSGSSGSRGSGSGRSGPSNSTASSSGLSSAQQLNRVLVRSELGSAAGSR